MELHISIIIIIIIGTSPPLHSTLPSGSDFSSFQIFEQPWIMTLYLNMFCRRQVALLVKKGVETRSLATVTGSCLKDGDNDMEVVKYPSFEGRDEDSFPCLTR